MPFRTRSHSTDAAIIGASCLLPGADTPAALWELMQGERNAISARPQGRWNVERFLRPGEPAPGFAYSFAGGYLADAFGFDPAPFNISPREAQQMDPQQRLLLTATWRACEDAGLPPSALSGRNIGVYVGASLADYQSVGAFDPAVIGSHFMTGNALSILANRISYVFDLKGPSFTADAACSSSFVALAQATGALAAGDVEMAIVGGVNMLLSPVPFIGFSQARMLSQTGLCRPFSEAADGYVRSEGAVVLILQREPDALRESRRIHSVVVAAGTNSDGRTNGISLPSQASQQHLIETVHETVGLDPDALSFVEAHGTGTKIGDPIEAAAIGRALGQRRSKPLPIGSVKSNIGHLEAASGLASLLKASLALEHGIIPRSLFADEPNTAIPFAELNIIPVTQALSLDATSGDRFAAVCNYGFGGTNGHAILRSARPVGTPAQEVATARVLLLSAATDDALKVRSAQLADVIAAGHPAATIAAALAHQQDRMAHRFAVSLSPNEGPASDVAAALRRFSNSGDLNENGATAVVHERPRDIIFVYSGNGAQFEQMGMAAYHSHARFRQEVDDIDRRYKDIAGWSIAERLREGTSSAELAKTSIAQPLIFAVQSALTAVLREHGIRPSGVLGHSVGEIAAAEASGLLTRAAALFIMHKRSLHQEAVQGEGRMLVVATDAAKVEAWLQQAVLTEVDIAAYNSAASTTVSGPARQLETLARLARKERVASVPLQVDYPFHSRALECVREPLLDDLGELSAATSEVPFYSTVTGAVLDASAMDQHYWWRNIRQPVRFSEALEAAIAAHDQPAFVEISPRPILIGPITDGLKTAGRVHPVLPSLPAGSAAKGDPIGTMLARMAVHDIGDDRSALFGESPKTVHALPPYPFQRASYRFEGTHEAISSHGRLIDSLPLHPLLGARLSDGSPEWRSLLDTVLVPYLTDHRVDGGVVMPAAGLIEIALAAGQELFGPVPLEIVEFDISKAMTFGEDETREVSTRYTAATHGIEVWSRRRFADSDEWILHAKGVLVPLADDGRDVSEALPRVTDPIFNEAAEIYAAAGRAGLDYGPHFQAVRATWRDETVGESSLIVPSGGTGAYNDAHVLHPVSLDSSFHGLFLARPQRDGERKAHLPIRFRRIRVWQPGGAITRSVTKLQRETQRFKSLSVALLDESGALVAAIDAAVLRSVHLVKPIMLERTFREQALPIYPVTLAVAASDLAVAGREGAPSSPLPLLIRALALSIAHHALADVLGPDGIFETAVSAGRVAEPALPLLERARDILAMAGALSSSSDGTKLSADFSLPSPHALLATLQQRFPAANRELRLAALAIAHASPLLRSGMVSAKPTLASLTETWSLQDLSAHVTALASDTLAAWHQPAGRPVRLLVVGDWNSGLAQALTEAVRAGRASVTLAVSDATHADEYRHVPGFGTLFDSLVVSGAANTAPFPFDALIGFATASSQHRASHEAALGGAMGQLASEAPIVLVEPTADLHLQFLMAASQTLSGTDDLVPFDGGDALVRRIVASGATAIGQPDNVGGLLTVIQARAATRPSRPARSATATATIGNEDAAVLFDRCALTSADRFDWDHSDDIVDWLASRPTPEPACLVVASVSTRAQSGSELAARVGSLSRLFARLASAEYVIRIVVLTKAAAIDGLAAGDDAGLAAFVRVAINEFPDLDIRLVVIADDEGAVDLTPVLGGTDGEREWRAEPSGLLVNRIHRSIALETPFEPQSRAVLHFADGAGLDGFEWLSKPRPEPQAGEVEVEVAAAGLNYRDIMVGLGLLDDDLLGAGLTQAALGFECSGTVCRVGPGVSRLKIGDKVMGFAAGAFASHVVCPDWYFFQVPDGVDLEAAATIPVAFSTAWYALVERGRVRAGETVLIHGAAGGVGLAALQIATHQGARALGTASTAARRAIALSAGAEAVFESRQERFASEIVRQYGQVDLVLNSLAGSAMLASFRLLKPFGRFLELGKRDFLDNTQLALRPFLRNIAYSGVDIDELLAADPALVRSMMDALAQAFAAQQLRPLPYRSYADHEVGLAFRTMQASEHIGKIVIRPPRQARVDLSAVAYHAKPGLYVIAGGTSGLGFATAQWLAAQGATHIALLSRRGQVEPDLVPAVEQLRNSGTDIIAKSVDIGDAAAVESMMASLVETHGPICGVVHAAVHLDDGLISNLTTERLQAVLRTKVDGLINLANATKDQPLDVFVAYSSATTLIGSPGQGAYVAANGFLEGFMRARRLRGQPALAIGWGAVADVGLIARDKQLGQRLRRTTGVVPLRSFEALAHLGRLLALGPRVDPVQFYAGLSPGAGSEKLALLKSPTFADLAHHGGDQRSGQAEDIGALLQGKSRDEAVEIVIGVLKREVGDILRMAESQVDLTRPLADLGLDSLMALELHMALEQSLGVQMAVVGAGDRNLRDLAASIVDQMGQTEAGGDQESAEPIQSTIIQLATAHTTMDISAEQASQIAAMVRRPSHDAAE